MGEESRSVKIRIKSGDSEVEIQASLSDIREAIELIPEILAKLPQASAEVRITSAGPLAEAPRPQEPAMAVQTSAAQSSSIPVVTIEKGDSLSDVISKFFSDPWGRSPRKLMEVREALQSYGLNYPKQSVAVALLRLAKGSRIRRFKGEGGEYVYTVSTGAVRVPVPMPAPVAAHAPTHGHGQDQGQAQPNGPQRASEEEAQPLETEGQEEEEQLNLDAPTAK